MKKTCILLITTVFILTSCSLGFQLSTESVMGTYIKDDRSINLNNKDIVGFLKLSEYTDDREINNIYLSSNSIDIIDVSDIESVIKLDISKNKVRFISDIRLPEKVRHLDISGNNIDSLKGLSNYSELKTLNISHTNISDEDLNELVKLNKLLFIKFEGLNLSTEKKQILNNLNYRFLLKNTDPFIKNTH